MKIEYDILAKVSYQTNLLFSGGNMIKLIICDLDGTLLPSGEKEINREIKNLIKLATEKGIKFVVASGRAYHELKSIFDDVSQELIFMPSDGALTVYREKTYYNKPLNLSAVENVIKIAATEKPGIVFSGKYLSSYMGEDKDFTSEILAKKHYMKVYNMADVEEDVYKLAFFGEPKTSFVKKALSGTYTNMLKIICKSGGWTEFIAPGAGKELAAKCMMDTLKIAPREVAVFGNDTNDVGMLSLSPNSFYVENSHPEAVKAAKHETSDIVKTLSEIIRKGDI